MIKKSEKTKKKKNDKETILNVNDKVAFQSLYLSFE